MEETDPQGEASDAPARGPKRRKDWMRRALAILAALQMLSLAPASARGLAQEPGLLAMQTPKLEDQQLKNSQRGKPFRKMPHGPLREGWVAGGLCRRPEVLQQLGGPGARALHDEAAAQGMRWSEAYLLPGGLPAGVLEGLLLWGAQDAGYREEKAERVEVQRGHWNLCQLTLAHANGQVALIDLATLELPEGSLSVIHLAGEDPRGIRRWSGPSELRWAKTTGQSLRSSG